MPKVGLLFSVDVLSYTYSMELSIRPAVQGDLPAITAILDQAVGSKMYHGDLAWGDKAYDDAALAAAINRGTLFVAELKDAGIVATFRLELQDDTLWGPQPPVAVYVQRFATAGGFRGQKLGQQIFDLIAQTVRNNGRQFIRLICPAENTKLCAYHESNGFTRVDFKAKPSFTSTPVVYYERLVDPNYQEPQSAPKQGFLHRLRRSRNGL